MTPFWAPHLLHFWPHLLVCWWSHSEGLISRRRPLNMVPFWGGTLVSTDGVVHYRETYGFETLVSSHIVYQDLNPFRVTMWSDSGLQTGRSTWSHSQGAISRRRPLKMYPFWDPFWTHFGTPSTPSRAPISPTEHGPKRILTKWAI